MITWRPLTDMWGWKAHFMGQFVRSCGGSDAEVRAAMQKAVNEGIAEQRAAKKRPKKKARK